MYSLLSGIVLFAGCTIQEVPFEYSAAQAQVLPDSTGIFTWRGS